MVLAEDDATSEMVLETARKLFSDFEVGAFEAAVANPRDQGAPWLPPLWEAVQQMGFPLALLDEARGGFGLDPLTSLGIVREAARHGLPLPLGETMLANLVLVEAGLNPTEDPAALAGGLDFTRESAGWRVKGVAHAVPWGRHLNALVGCDGAGRIARLTEGWQVEPGQNIAGEPRDRLILDTVVPQAEVVEAGLGAELVQALGALIRAQAIAGALEGILAKTIAYTQERVQFGRPLSKFQVIQHNIAIIATNTAAARAAADMAAATLPRMHNDPEGFRRRVAAAKLRAGEAASLCAPLAHQVHGAIGITREYPLHPLTNRLWAWRDEHGAEVEWADWLGANVLQHGQAAYWLWLADETRSNA